jgi:hypothetical protein
MLEERTFIDPKKFKRALVGFSLGRIEMSENDAISRLMKKGVVKSRDQAFQLLESAVGWPAEYSCFGEFNLSRTDKGYMMSVYPVRHILDAF